MKRIAILFAAMILGIGGLSARNSGNVSNQLISLAGQYKHYEDFEVVKIGPLLMKLVKWTADKEMDPTDEDTWAFVEGVKKFVVVDYDDASEKVKSEFNAKAAKILAKSEVLMEAKDEGDLVKIYGNVSEDGSKVSDLVIFVPSDGAMICISGTVGMGDIQNIMSMTNRTGFDR